VLEVKLGNDAQPIAVAVGGRMRRVQNPAELRQCREKGRAAGAIVRASGQAVRLALIDREVTVLARVVLDAALASGHGRNLRKDRNARIPCRYSTFPSVFPSR